MFSLQDGFRSIGDLWGPMAFHAITMALGSFCIGKAAGAVPTNGRAAGAVPTNGKDG